MLESELFGCMGDSYVATYPRRLLVPKSWDYRLLKMIFLLVGFDVHSSLNIWGNALKICYWNDHINSIKFWSLQTLRISWFTGSYKRLVLMSCPHNILNYVRVSINQEKHIKKFFSFKKLTREKNDRDRRHDASRFIFAIINSHYKNYNFLTLFVSEGGQFLTDWEECLVST